MVTAGAASSPTLKTLRAPACSRRSAASTYSNDVSKTIEILQNVLATEIVCVLRYTMHSIAAAVCISRSEAVQGRGCATRQEEQEHMTAVAERINNQLGGRPNFSPEWAGDALGFSICRGRESRRHDQGESDRGAMADSHRSLSRAGCATSVTMTLGTRVMLEGILVVEEEHANDMHDTLLVNHEGRPMLER